MILQTKAAKIILLLLALWLLCCAIFIAITGWNPNSSSVTTSVSESAPEISSVPEQSQTLQPEQGDNPSPKPSEIAQADIPNSNIDGIYMVASYDTIVPGQQFSVDVMANTSGLGISGCELMMQFDPVIFQALDITPGDLLGQSPLIGTEEANNQAGTLKYALARKGLTSADDSTGVLATIDLYVMDTASEGFHSLKLPEVKLTDENFNNAAGMQVQGAIVQVGH